MPTDLPSSVGTGYSALATAQWTEARQQFEAALRETDAPEAHDGLGISLWWLNDIPAAHHQRTLAYNKFKERGDLSRALVLASWLAREQVFFSGNIPAMHGWFSRADSLARQLAPCVELLWHDLMRASVLAPPAELEQNAAQIGERAREYSDSNLEAFALAFCGMAQVSQGRVSEGMSRLDEAMTMAMGGEVSDYMVVSEIFCVLLSACETSGDLIRTDHWCQVALEFSQRRQCTFLSAYCRTTYGGLLVASGRWQDAEQTLLDAIRLFDAGHKGLRVHAVIRLAELRVWQGRLHEAETMLAGLEDHGSAVVPLARLHLAKGERALARAVLEQALPPTDHYTLGDLPRLFLLADILLDEGDTAAETIAEQIMDVAQTSQSAQLMAQAQLLRGRGRSKAGDTDGARESYAAALDGLRTYEQSLLAGQIRLHMAQTLRLSDPPAALVWAKAANATFERIGATHLIAEAGALLRRLGASSPASRSRPLTQREIEIVTLVAGGLTNREIAERLVISPKTVEHHVGSIFDKLNLRNRAEAAALLASGKLSELIVEAHEER